MSILAVNRAIRARLRGEPVDKQGRSIAKKGVLIPQIEEKSKGASQSSEGNWEAKFVPGAFRQIPIFHYKDDGKLWSKIVPRVMYGRAGFEFEPEQSVIRPGETVGSAGQLHVVKDAEGTVVETGYSKRKIQLRPDSYRHIYQISIVAENVVERELILESVLMLFRARGHLEYKQRDGSTVVVDMLQQDVQDQDVVVGELEDRQGVETVLTYVVEAFEDTTPFITEEPNVVDARVEISPSSNPEAQTTNTELTLFEAEPVQN